MAIFSLKVKQIPRPGGLKQSTTGCYIVSAIVPRLYLEINSNAVGVSLQTILPVVPSKNSHIHFIAS